MRLNIVCAAALLTLLGVVAAAALGVASMTVLVVAAAVVTGVGWVQLQGLTAARAHSAVIAVVELDQEGPIAKMFGFRPFAWVGKISYGLYLWHWPVFVMISPTHTSLSGAPLFVVRFAVSFALGTISFYLLEEPIRRYGVKRWFGRTVGIISGYAVLPLRSLTPLP